MKATTIDEYWFWLCNIDGIGSKKADRLIKRFGNPEEIYRAGAKELSLAEGITEQDIHNIKESRKTGILKEKYEYMNRKAIQFIHRESELFPWQLKEMTDCPYGLFVKGNAKRLTQGETNGMVSVVGARNSSSYGNHIAEQMGFELAVHGVTVISGMARGIDASAHWGAVHAKGQTIAVLGCGADICYPRENINLYEAILEHGVIISEYPCQTPPTAWQFPMRNRIISGLADRVVVVEARKESGSLITVEYALQQGKDVMAVPGRIDDKLSEGCNQLIREGAELITGAKDILDNLSIDGRIHYCKNFVKKKFMLEKELESVYSYVDLFPKSIQTISDESGKKPEELIGLLIQLQMLDLIDEPAKNYYSKK